MMTKEFVQVKEGQRFAGGILTEQGAFEVNAGRIRTAVGKKESIFVRIARRLVTEKRPDLAERMTEEDKKIYF